MFYRYIFKSLIFLLLFQALLFSKETELSKTTDYLSNISSIHLYTYDTDTISSLMNKTMLKDKQLFGIIITDKNSDDIFYKSYKYDGKIIADKTFPPDIKTLVSFKNNIVHNGEMIGTLRAYYKIIDENAFNKEELAWLKNTSYIPIATMSYWIDNDAGETMESSLFGLFRKYAGVNLVARKYDVWKDAYADAKKGDMIYGVSRLSWSKFREKNFFDYSQPYFFTPLLLITKRSNSTIENLSDLKTKSIFTIEETVASTYIQKTYPTIKTTQLETNNQLYKELSKSSTTQAALIYSIDSKMIKKYDLKVVQELFNEYGEISIGINHRYPILTSIVKKAYKMIPKHKLAYLAKMSFNSSRVKLSIAERNYVKNHPVIKVGDGNSWAPIGFVNSKGIYVGLSKDYLDIIGQNTGLTFEMTIGNWSELYESMLDENSTDIDMLNTISYAKKRTKHLSYTDRYLTMVKYFYKRDDVEIKPDGTMDGLRVAIPKNYTDNDIIKKNFPLLKIVQVESFDEAISAVVSKKAELLFDNNAVLLYSLQKRDIHNIVPLKIFRAEGIDEVRMASRKNNPLLASIISKGIASLTQIQKDTIYKKWIGKQVAKAEPSKIELSIKEREWIKRHPVIHFVSDPEYKPFEFVDENGNYSGIASSYLKLLAKKTGLVFKQVPTKDWADAVDAVKSKKADMFTCIKKTSPRMSSLNFTQPYMSYPMVMVAKMDVPFLNSIEDLYGKTVVSIKDFAITNFLQRNHPEIKLIEVDNTIEALTQISRGRAYAFISALPTATNYINQEGFYDLKIAGKLDRKTSLGMAIRNDWDDTGVKIINRALNTISQTQKNNIYNRWVSVTLSKRVDYTIVFQILFVFGVILLATLFWMRKLKLEIKKRKVTEEKLQKITILAEQANRAKSEFLANMSHEIRTPMNAIIGFTELLDEDIKDPRLQSYTKTIKSAGSSLLTLINDILDLSKIEAGKLTITNRPTNLRDLSNEMNAIFSMTTSVKKLDFIIHVDDNIPSSLFIDEIRLRQILINLIGNAVKFTEKGYIKLSIKAYNIKNHLSKLNLEIDVEDSGIGIPKEQLESVFKIFEQQEGQDNRKFGGTGLGLSISRKLTNLMDGKISVKSIYGQGSTFCVHLHNVSIPSVQQRKKIDSMNAKHRYNFKSSKILVVDDIEENRDLIVYNFENTAIEVITAVDGLEAVRLNSQHSPALILMDLRMPNMNGYEAAKIIKKSSTVPIISLTASVMNDEHEQKKGADFDGFLRKPVLQDELFKEVAKYLPHTKRLEPKAKKVEKQLLTLSPNAKSNLEFILKSMREDISPLKKKALSNNNINEIKKMNTLVELLADKFDIAVLKKYTKDLAIAVESFDIAMIQMLLKEYETILKRLEAQL